MRLPSHTSIGLFAGAIALAVTAGACSAANSTVVIGNPSGNTTAYVAPTRQLETTMTAPSNVVHVFGEIAPGSCSPIYTPPAGKAVVVTQLTYDIGSGTQGTESWAELEANCTNDDYDIADTVQANEAQSHTFPSGLPMSKVQVYDGGGGASIFVSMIGYLIPATQLPQDSPENLAPRHRARGSK